MNKRTLWVMLGLVVVGGLLILMQGDNVPTADTADPLRRIDYSRLTRIACETPGMDPWRLELQDGRFMLISASIAEGKPVAANEEVRHRLIGFLQDSRPVSSRRVKDLDLAEWGLEPPAVKLTLDDGQAHEIHIGRADLEDEVYYYAQGGETAYKVGADALGDFSLEPRWLRDPGLADVPPHLVRKATVARSGEIPYSLIKVGRRWFVEPEGGLRVRGDFAVCEQVVVGLAGLRGEPLAAGEAVETEGDGWPVTLTADDGSIHRYRILKLDRAAGDVIAQRDDEPDHRRVKKDMLRFLVKDAADLEDSRLLGFELRDLEEVIVEGVGRPRPLRLRKGGRRWFLELGPGFAWRVDGEALTPWKDGLFGQKILSRVPEKVDFTDATTVRFVFDLPVPTPDVVLRVGEPGPDGNRYAARSDEAGTAVVGPELGALLGRRYWDLMARDVAAGSDVGVDRLDVLGEDGKDWKLVLEETPDGKRWETTQGTVVATEFIQPLLSKLSFLTCAGFGGEVTPEQAAEMREKARYRIGWDHPEPNAPENPDLTLPHAAVHKEWWVCRRRGDVHWECLISTFPNLVFLVEGQDLLQIEGALRGIRNAQ